MYNSVGGYKNTRNLMMILRPMNTLKCSLKSWKQTTFLNSNKSRNYTVDCQQLKRTGARSAGHSAACNDFIPTAYVRNKTTLGYLAH